MNCPTTSTLVSIALLAASSIASASAFSIHTSTSACGDTHPKEFPLPDNMTELPFSPFAMQAPRNSLLPPPSITKPLTYDSIQDAIDVSRPYYKLENEANVLHPLTQESLAFICTINPEMPHSFESGSMSMAEAGRHGAIAGSVAAALNNEVSGKFYYLALDAIVRKKPTSKDLDDDLKSHLQSKSLADSSTKIIAVNSEQSNRDAKSEIYLVDDTGSDMWHLTITYKKIPYKAFSRFFPRVVDDLLIGPWDPSTPNPYVAEHDTNILTTSPYPGSTTHTSVAHLPPCDPIMCAGHFDTNPAYPIAFLCSSLLNIAAKSIGHMAKVPLSYTARTSTNDVHGDCYAVRKNSVTPIQCVLNAQTLCMAGTYGIDVTCKTTLIPPAEESSPKMYHCSIKAISDDDEQIAVAKCEITYTLDGPAQEEYHP